MKVSDEHLLATEFLDHDHPAVAEYARRHSEGADSPRDQIVQIYYAVRDGFLYNPYVLDLRRSGLKASNLLTRKSGYCIEKGILLAACARALGIPSRLSFYIVRNHIGTEKLEKLLKKNYLVFHGAAELFLEDRWIKATPAFNSTLCRYLGVEPLEFNGTQDAIFQQYDNQGNVFMTYLHDYGAFSDMPYELYLQELRTHYHDALAGQQYEREPLFYDFTRSAV